MLSDFKVLSFDCYGTLIDWEAGITRALAKLGAGRELLQAFARHESSLEREHPGLPYPKILERVYLSIAEELGVGTTGEDCIAFGASVGDWPALSDSAPALAYLKQHCKLVILSNVDRASFRRSNERLGVEFDFVFTAEDIGSYKPDPRNFEYMLGRLAEGAYEKRDILHVAESLFHDHAPANSIGLASAWIHRRLGKEGFGATAPPQSMPKCDFKFGSMAELAAAHREFC